jgi:hypothetical protein
MSQTLRSRIEAYLKTTATAPTRFSRDVSNDPRLVTDIRHGREVRPMMAARLSAYLEARGQ